MPVSRNICLINFENRLSDFQSKCSGGRRFCNFKVNVPWRNTLFFPATLHGPCQKPELRAVLRRAAPWPTLLWFKILLFSGPRQSDSRSSEVNTRLTNTLVPPPTLLMPMPCFVPIPFPIPLLIPVPYDKFYKNEVSASNSGSEETMEDNTSGEENEQNRQRRRSLIMDKPLRNAER